MTIKNAIKKVFLKTPSFFRNNVYKVYDYIFYPLNRKSRKSFGDKNKNKTFYVIRPRNNTVEGLMSLLLNDVRQLRYAQNNNYIPVFDYSYLQTQYLDSNNKHNVWEDYYIQNISLNEVYESNNVIYSGLSPTRTDFIAYNSWTNDDQIKESRELIKRYIHVNEEVEKRLNNELDKINVDNTLGLYIRGTDYVGLKPAGHPKQPEVESVFAKAEEYVDKYNISNIFLVTEDKKVYDMAGERFGDMLKIASFDSFIDNYGGSTFLSNDKSIKELSNNTYLLGMNYLVKILVLSKLNYLVGGKTNGTWAAMSFSNGYKDYYIFELGNY